MVCPRMSISHLNQAITDPAMMKSLARRFWAKVSVLQPHECWPWVSKSVAKYGYGRMTAGRGRYLRAHQVAWALENGPIPDGSVIRHTCDKTYCCNPKHLQIGTQKQNTRDAMDRGRASPPPILHGEKARHAKLNVEDVQKIRASSATLEHLAKEYSVSSKSIWRIKNRLTWKHIHDDGISARCPRNM